MLWYPFKARPTFSNSSSSQGMKPPQAHRKSVMTMDVLDCSETDTRIVYCVPLIRITVMNSGNATISASNFGSDVEVLSGLLADDTFVPFSHSASLLKPPPLSEVSTRFSLSCLRLPVSSSTRVGDTTALLLTKPRDPMLGAGSASWKADSVPKALGKHRSPKSGTQQADQI